MKRDLFKITLYITVALGCWHLWIAAHALFVFRENESIAAWFAVILGPLSTLPASLIAARNAAFGGGWIAAGGLLSLSAFALTESTSVNDLFGFALRVSLPMLVFGPLLLLFSRARRPVRDPLR